MGRSRFSGSRRVAVSAASAALLLIVAGCGSDRQRSASATSPRPQTASPTARGPTGGGENEDTRRTRELLAHRRTVTSPGGVVVRLPPTPQTYSLPPGTHCVPDRTINVQRPPQPGILSARYVADRVVAVHYRLDDTPHCQTASLYATLDSSTAYQASAVERTVPIRGARAREGRLLLTVPSHLRSRPNFVTLLPVAQSGRRGEVARVLISGT